MKRIITLLLALILCPSFALAQVDLSGMTYDELVALKDQINLAIWNSAEWQEVEVPYGVWTVGKDIPAGKWEIKVSENAVEAFIKWGDVLDETGLDYSFKGKITEYELLQSASYQYRKTNSTDRVIWDLKEGTYFFVDSGSVIFSPYSGQPSLGFRRTAKKTSNDPAVKLVLSTIEYILSFGNYIYTDYYETNGAFYINIACKDLANGVKAGKENGTITSIWEDLKKVIVAANEAILNSAKAYKIPNVHVVLTVLNDLNYNEKFMEVTDGKITYDYLAE